MDLRCDVLDRLLSELFGFGERGTGRSCMIASPLTKSKKKNTMHGDPR